MTAVGDPFYKITSEALMVTQQLVKVIRPHGMSQMSQYFESFFVLHVCEIYVDQTQKLARWTLG